MLDGNESEVSDASDSDRSDEDIVSENGNVEDSSSSSDSSSDDEPLANLIPAPTNKKKSYRWMKKPFTSPDVSFGGASIPPPASAEPETPLQYFQRFITDDMLEDVAEHTNQYSTQQTGKCLNTTKKELEKVIGMFFCMGLVQMPGNRVYWESNTRYRPVSEVISRNRFQSII